MKILLSFVAASILLGLSAAILLGGLYYWVRLPIVLMAYPIGECVEVIPESAGSCDHLPDRYETEWVSPVYERKN